MFITINFLLRAMFTAYRTFGHVMFLLASRWFLCLGFFFDPLVVPPVFGMKIDLVG